MLLRVKNVKPVRSKGRTYYYHRKTGERLPDDPANAAARADEINRADDQDSRSLDARPGSMGDLIAAYRGAPEWRALRERTQADYARYLRFFEDGFADLAVAELDTETVLELRDRFADTPRKADYLVQVLSVLSTFAMRRPRRFGLAINPCAAVGRINKARPYMPWPDNLLAAVRDGGYPELVWAIQLGLYTGQRKSDCTAMSWSHYADGMIAVTQQKTAARVWIPAHPRLADLLGRIERRAAVILTTRTGRPWRREHLEHEILKAVRAAGFSGYSFHGLRKNAARTLAEAGCTTHEIMAITGHRTEAMVRHYTRDADRKRLATAAIEKLEISSKKERQAGKSGKPR